MEYSGTWGKLINEKNQKQKSCDTVTLNHYIAVHFIWTWPPEDIFFEGLLNYFGTFCTCTNGFVIFLLPCEREKNYKSFCLLF
jgi:hypothetical protein